MWERMQLSDRAWLAEHLLGSGFDFQQPQSLQEAYFILIYISILYYPVSLHTVFYHAFRIDSWIRVLWHNFWVAKDDAFLSASKIMYLEPVTLKVTFKTEKSKVFLVFRRIAWGCSYLYYLRVLSIAYSYILF